MTSQETINHFFIEDKQLTPDRLKVKRSVLLALIEDLKFTILLPGKWKNLNLSAEQNVLLNEMLPTFTVIAQFCSAVDLLARVINKGRPGRGENGEYFKDCACTWFNLEREEADQLWLLRNGISHSYRLETGQVANRYGHGRIISKSSSGLWHFYLHAMYTTLIHVSSNMYNNLSSESEQDKSNTANYLDKNGFFYTLAN